METTYKKVDGKPPITQDDPEDYEFVVTISLMELEEELEQRLENRPKGKNSEIQWKKDVNRLVKDINEQLGWNKHKLI